MCEGGAAHKTRKATDLMWSRAVDEASGGVPYYFNEVTKESSWTLPAGEEIDVGVEDGEEIEEAGPAAAPMVVATTATATATAVACDIEEEEDEENHGVAFLLQEDDDDAGENQEEEDLGDGGVLGIQLPALDKVQQQMEDLAKRRRADEEEREKEVRRFVEFNAANVDKTTMAAWRQRKQELDEERSRREAMALQANKSAYMEEFWKALDSNALTSWDWTSQRAKAGHRGESEGEGEETERRLPMQGRKGIASVRKRAPLKTQVCSRAIGSYDLDIFVHSTGSAKLAWPKALKGAKQKKKKSRLRTRPSTVRGPRPEPKPGHQQDGTEDLQKGSKQHERQRRARPSTARPRTTPATRMYETQSLLDGLVREASSSLGMPIGELRDVSLRRVSAIVQPKALQAQAQAKKPTTIQRRNTKPEPQAEGADHSDARRSSRMTTRRSTSTRSSMSTKATRATRVTATARKPTLTGAQEAEAAADAADQRRRTHLAATRVFESADASGDGLVDVRTLRKTMRNRTVVGQLASKHDVAALSLLCTDSVCEGVLHGMGVAGSEGGEVTAEDFVGVCVEMLCESPEGRERLREFRELFTAMDRNGNGSVEVHELKAALRGDAKVMALLKRSPVLYPLLRSSALRKIVDEEQTAGTLEWPEFLRVCRITIP